MAKGKMVRADMLEEGMEVEDARGSVIIEDVRPVAGRIRVTSSAGVTIVTPGFPFYVLS